MTEPHCRSLPLALYGQSNGPVDPAGYSSSGTSPASHAARTIRNQRELRDELSELARMRHASARVARHSLVWRTQIKPVVQENEDAGHLDLLGGSCLMLTRTSLGTDDDDRRLLAPRIEAFSTTLSELAGQLGDRDARQRAVDRSLGIARKMRSLRTDPDPELTAALMSARMAVLDLMDFVGVDPDEARAATREEPRRDHDLEVPARPATTGARLHVLPRWLRRRFG